MKQTETVVVPATTRERETRVVCDICGKVGNPHDRDPFDASEDGDNVNACKIEHEHGYSFSGDYQITTESFDVCPECWARVLVPLFKNPPSVRVFE